MDIYIVSRGRPLTQATLGNLPLALRERVVLMVPLVEVQAYRNANPGVKIKGCPKENTIGDKRQYIIDHAANKVLMLDDDMSFATRRVDDPTKFVPATDEDIEKMVEYIDNQLESFAHVGVSTREGANRDTERYRFNARMLRVLGYRADVLRKSGIQFTRLPVMEDFDVTLQLLRKGYENILLNWIVHDQKGSNLPGGCALYRTPEVQDKAANELARLHPDFVRVVTKTPKAAWGGQPRTDVVIYWKQALGAEQPISAVRTTFG